MGLLIWDRLNIFQLPIIKMLSLNKWRLEIVCPSALAVLFADVLLSAAASKLSAYALALTSK